MYTLISVLYIKCGNNDILYVTWATLAWHNTPVKFRKGKHILVRFISTVSSLSYLHNFPTKWYGLELWPLTLKNNTFFSLIQVIKWTISFCPTKQSHGILDFKSARGITLAKIYHSHWNENYLLKTILVNQAVNMAKWKKKVRKTVKLRLTDGCTDNTIT
jgi:hypothetical protein